MTSSCSIKIPEYFSLVNFSISTPEQLRKITGPVLKKTTVNLRCSFANW